jgi:hypothetical protein
MKVRILAVLASAVFMFAAPPADAMTGSQFYRSCRAPKDSSSYANCRAYIAGFFGGYLVSTGVSRLREFCPPPGLTTEQIWKKAEPFLKPPRGKFEDELADTVLEIALLRAYPCKKPK